MDTIVREKWHPEPPPFRGRLIAVGGQCSKVGKTALLVDLLSALREDADQGWTAIKISPHAEFTCPINGNQCPCGPDEHVVSVREEDTAGSGTDTARFLAAGARRALWVQTKPGRLREALPVLAAALESANHVIIESNAILQFWQPAALCMVLDPVIPDFKPSARQAMLFADAFVLRSPLCPPRTSEWRSAGARARPTFLQLLGEPLPAGVQELARQLLAASPHLLSRHYPDH